MKRLGDDSGVDPLVKEWKRLMIHARIEGVPATVEHVIGLIETGNYPLY